jgi:hypothetical protein
MEHCYSCTEEEYQRFVTYTQSPPYGVRKFGNPSKMSCVINQSFLRGEVISAFSLLVMQQIDRFLFTLRYPHKVDASELTLIKNQLRFIFFKESRTRSHTDIAKDYMKLYCYLDYFIVDLLLPICFKKGNFNRKYYQNNAEKYLYFINNEEIELEIPVEERVYGVRTYPRQSLFVGRVLRDSSFNGGSPR